MSRKQFWNRGRLLRWTMIVVVGLMLAAMLMYVASQDEADPGAVLDAAEQASSEGAAR